MIYIAAPFFNLEQLAVVECIESTLEKNNLEYFSPRSEGVLLDMNDEDRVLKIQEIYDSNIRHLNDCDNMIAVVDGRDSGVIFEIGYFAALSKVSKKRIITFTNKNFGLNVMIQKTVCGHVHGFKKLNELCSSIKHFGFASGTFDEYLDFDEGVY